MLQCITLSKLQIPLELCPFLLAKVEALACCKVILFPIVEHYLCHLAKLSMKIQVEPKANVRIVQQTCPCHFPPRILHALSGLSQVCHIAPEPYLLEPHDVVLEIIISKQMAKIAARRA